jgi:HEAT repeat protein
MQDLIDLSPRANGELSDIAIEGLTRLQHPECFARLEELLKSEEPGIRRSILMRLEDIQDDTLTSRVAGEVYSADATRASFAASALKGNHRDAAVTALIYALENGEPQLKAAAANALQGCSAHPATVARILSAFESRNPLVKSACALALKDTTNREAIKALRSALPDPRGDQLYGTAEIQMIQQCVASLSRQLALDDPAAYYPGLGSASPDVRHSAIMFLELHKDQKTVERLIPLLKDDHVRVAAAAAKALAGCRYRSGIEALAEAASHRHFMVREAAIGSLATIFH